MHCSLIEQTILVDMAQAGGLSLTALYTDLSKFGQNQDFERALKVANKSMVFQLFQKSFYIVFCC